MAEDQTHQEPTEQTSEPPENKRTNYNKRLNPRQKDFIRAFIKNGGLVVEAAKTAGYPFPKVQGGRVLRDIMKRPDMVELMEEEGLTDRVLLQPLKAALKANVTAAYEGSVFESDVPDHTLRLRAIETAFKLNGRIQTKVETKINAPGGKVMVVYVNPNGELDSSGEDLLRSSLPTSERNPPTPGEIPDTGLR